MIKLIIRVLEKILGSFTVFCGGFGSGTGNFVPQIGHVRTPSSSSVPQVGHFTMVSSPFDSLILLYHTMRKKGNKASYTDENLLYNPHKYYRI